jgi:hypothetical protein
MRHVAATCVHPCVLACDIVSAAKPCQIFTKFSLVVLYKKLSSRGEFRENWFSDSHTLLKGIHEFLSLCSIILASLSEI